MRPERGARIADFVLRSRRAAGRRALAIAALDATGLATATAWLAAVTAGITLRGDLAQPALGWAILGVVLVRLALVVRGSRRLRRGALAVIRLIARHPGPLRREAFGDARWLQADRRLRQELLAAAELLDELADAADSDRDDAQRTPLSKPGQSEPGQSEPGQSEPGQPARARGSAVLARRYIDDVEHRIDDPDVEPAYALPRPGMRARGLAGLGLAAAMGVSVMLSPVVDGLGLLVAGADARPPVPPEPVWASLTLELEYPGYTRRPKRVVPNPSGALRVPAGTVVSFELTARRPAGAGRLVVSYDAPELSEAPAPEVTDLEEGDDPRGLKWRGQFTARGSGAWTIVLLDEEGDDPGESPRHSPALPLLLELDRAPEVELLPLPRDQREVREDAAVDVRFTARDDFGLTRAELVYQLPDGTAHRLTVPPPARPRRSWRGRYSWDISQIPIAERSEVLYWLEVRDNDPGLSLAPLPDPPGKTTRSATMRLLVRDDEAEHAQNITKLRDIRDFAVDLLAMRMLTLAFETPEEAEAAGRGAISTEPLATRRRATMARDLLARSGQLLAMVSDAIDALSMDSLAHERDVATLTDIHGRLIALHRSELALHEGMPPRSEVERPEDARTALLALRPHNDEEITQLEDEIIRLDDLVDGQIIERLEALVARLEATQRKLVELLEQLRAGDDSVRSQIEQLEQRRREDLRRIAEARAMLSKEVDEEFMNLDAFEVLRRMQSDAELGEMLQRGEVDEALEQAQQQLGEIQGLRDQVQRRLGEAEEGPELSEEDKKRMQLLRELSRLQDEEGNVRTRTRTLHERWREAVGEQEADDASRQAAGKRAEALREKLDEVNDARLGREGRAGLQDAREAAERLEDLASREDASALELAEAAEAIEKGLRRAEAGAEASESEGKALGRERGRASDLFDDLVGALPSAAETLSPDDQQELEQLEEQQRGLDSRARSLLDDPLSDLLPDEGRRAMRRARKGMQEGVRRLDGMRPGGAIEGQSRAWKGIQDAIDSLRRGSPPPQSSSSGEASTDTDRDTSLREELLDAMREDPPEGYAEPVERYYEELLR